MFKSFLKSFGAVSLTIGSAIALLFLVSIFQSQSDLSKKIPLSYGIEGTQPLVMQGGDPYIRALMRTITASEANDPEPYTIIYGGQRVTDLSQHPEWCVPIVAGPNQGNCTTAAGRYQFINTTWYEKAERYHPKSSGLLWWKTYSFEPQYQDAVVYEWLKDSQAWNANISQMLQEGKIKDVLRLLSGTWTSLGYGIETNSMSDRLPKIYENMLKEELEKRGENAKITS
ncbi:glycoside hydrolase family protein [Spirulina sp. 06S082]|uniref:glycoside hydrolase family 24 protein n=1 Tax=Spirulina sp. 06S082 TaxID=3110248 RepID=UPI002B216B80|nr:glycoside hydrolase family protein [Spirulina sp. 06S082]MEA5467767.1 glycoside hydrolase family protein [Spirulina sp. 06S082]